MRTPFIFFCGFTTAFIIVFVLIAASDVNNTSSGDENLTDQFKQLEEQVAQLSEEQSHLKPHLGSLMNGIQQHHAKLYYSGKEENWKLAEFNLHEIEEGFEEVSKFHPQHDGISIKQLVGDIIEPAIENLDRAIEEKNADRFADAFNVMTASCNNCHIKAGHGFVRIKEPKGSDFLNQEFAMK